LGCVHSRDLLIFDNVLAVALASRWLAARQRASAH
jgi:hypothetical protein